MICRAITTFSGITKDGGFILKPTTFDNIVGQNPKSSPVERNVWRNECRIAYGYLDSIEGMTSSLGQTGASGFEEVSNLGKYIGDLELNQPEDYSI